MTATPTGSGIPTRYHNTRFRSRLEARWAAFFDLVGWRWTYEPFDADGWIPDFLITGERPFLVEVGPCVTEAEYRAKAAKPLRFTERPTLVLGAVARPAFASDYADLPPDPGYAGLLVNEVPHVASGDVPAFRAFWFWPDARGSAAVFSDFDCLPDGSFRTHGHADPALIEVLWRRAGNDVAWRSR